MKYVAECFLCVWVLRRAAEERKPRLAAVTDALCSALLSHRGFGFLQGHARPSPSCVVTSLFPEGLRCWRQIKYVHLFETYRTKITLLLPSSSHQFVPDWSKATATERRKLVQTFMVLRGWTLMTFEGKSVASGPKNTLVYEQTLAEAWCRSLRSSPCECRLWSRLHCTAACFYAENVQKKRLVMCFESFSEIVTKKISIVCL